ncbi:hypothetical protein V6N11_008815 [Hibiscus sabdariffa]|uniref:RNase H type-1 domain-containing protein n=1 Tax=Hibiscus sabdariffa TaxID=183260 RepID=A0ABR1ZVI9_9ROSI
MAATSCSLVVLWSCSDSVEVIVDAITILPIPLPMNPKPDIPAWVGECTGLYKREVVPSTCDFWMSPPLNVTKVDFDYSFFGAKQKSHTGVVIHDDRGFLLGLCITIHHKVASSFVAEAIAAVSGFQLHSIWDFIRSFWKGMLA